MATETFKTKRLSFSLWSLIFRQSCLWTGCEVWLFLGESSPKTPAPLLQPPHAGPGYGHGPPHDKTGSTQYMNTGIGTCSPQPQSVTVTWTVSLLALYTLHADSQRLSALRTDSGNIHRVPVGRTLLLCSLNSAPQTNESSGGSPWLFLVMSQGVEMWGVSHTAT